MFLAGSMAKRMLQSLAFCWVLLMLQLEAKTNNVYVVYLGAIAHDNPADIKASHHAILSELVGSKEAARASMLYSYRYAFSGFAAILNKSQAEKLAEFPGVVRVMPDRLYQLHTTRSWDFLRLNTPSPSNILSESKMGDGVIIGLIDSGIWTESQSFDDTGMTPVPARWKGICQHGELFNSSHCNKKLIGARFFTKGLFANTKAPIDTTKGAEYLSPRDAGGHGTHTASTAAGRLVANASYQGLALGTARGGAPLARIASYKVCWATTNCADVDIAKAIDMAVRDGVDVISMSMGKELPLTNDIGGEDDIVLIASFHAVGKGVPVVCSGGNHGPLAQTVENTAPWVTTVAATTIDRAFPASIVLGNNHTLLGQSMNTKGLTGGFHELAYSEKAGSGSCKEGTLDATFARGKFILCFSVGDSSFPEASKSVAAVGGIGMIFAQFPDSLLKPCIEIPCVIVDYEVGTKILSYFEKTRLPIVKLQTPETITGKWVSPKVAFFSSRGPSSLSPSVLKPDIAAPGVGILAAARTPATTDDAFVFLSGTSMACPHISGITALIKSVHRDWSPAAIKSALITTASQIDNSGAQIGAEDGTRKEADPFDYGGGNVDANQAANPGLIYNMSTMDYVPFFCMRGYRRSVITKLLGKETSCDRNTSIIYDSEYRALVRPPHGIEVTVKPDTLCFNSSVTSIKYEVTFSSTLMMQKDYAFGSLTWIGGKHSVRSPIIVRSIIYDSYADISKELEV